MGTAISYDPGMMRVLVCDTKTNRVNVFETPVPRHERGQYRDCTDFGHPPINVGEMS